jgi:putative membrane protein
MQRDYDSHVNRGKFPTVFVVIAAAVIAVIVIIIAVFAYFSSRNSYYGYGYYGGSGMMGGWMGFPMLFMIPIMLIVLVVIGYAIWRGFGWGGGCCGGHYGHYASDEERETAMEILRRRYARGEITQEQFERMKKDIIT